MSEITTAAFLAKGSSGQFRYILSHYDEALRLKAESKSKKPQELIKLDQWYQKEFPKKIKSRGKDPHIIHDELVTIMKWKLARGKFRPRLKELVTMNSPRVVETESRKAFRALFKKEDLGASIQYLCNLKGIGPATASAIVTAAAPDRAAFMADECLAAVPEIEGIDYTLQEYLEMLKHIQQAVTRLGGPDEWNPHQVEMALWTHHILLTYKPMLLQDMPDDTIPPQEDSLGSTLSSDSKEIMFNHDSGGDSNSLNVDYNNYEIKQPSSFVDEDTLDNVVDVSSKLSNNHSSSTSSNNNQPPTDKQLLQGEMTLNTNGNEERADSSSVGDTDVIGTEADVVTNLSTTATIATSITTIAADDSELTVTTASQEDTTVVVAEISDTVGESSDDVPAAVIAAVAEDGDTKDEQPEKRHLEELQSQAKRPKLTD